MWREKRSHKLAKCAVFFSVILLAGQVLASDWPHWRGPSQNGVSTEIDLISSWSLNGENMIWRADFIGRSTPIVLNGKVYVFGRSGEGETKQERVAAFDARTGQLLWDYHQNVYNTAVPHKRVAWASMAGDTETGNVYSLGGGGLFTCFSENGKVLWQRSMTDEFNVRTGFGGRTVSPIVDEDLVIIAFVSSSWGSHAPPFMRYYAFDKRSGEIRWISAPGGQFTNPNVYSTPVIAEINGERLMISGNADGNIHAVKVRTGEKVWQFNLSKRGLHSSVVVSGNTIFAAHGEENHDTTLMGRIVAIDATGKGNVTESHEKWRIDGVEVGYTSLMVKDDRLYFVDNSANLHAVNTASGNVHWTHNLGTVGKASPVWADGKIFYPEVNGRFHILEPGDSACRTLDLESLTVPDGRYAELYGSPAIAYGRIYFVSEEGVYCLGNKNKRFELGSKQPMRPEPAPSNAQISQLQVVPADVTLTAGERTRFRVRGLDAKGRFVREVDVDWDTGGLPAQIDGRGNLTADAAQGAVGMLKASYSGLDASARVRIFQQLPWHFDFESQSDGTHPPTWLGAGNARSPATKFLAKKILDNTVIVKPVSARGVQRGITYIGPPTLANYTIQAEVMSQKVKRKVSDIGLINGGYTIELMGAKQKVEVRSWISELRMSKNVTFRWEPDVWYVIKFQVQADEEKAIVRGKVWKKGDAEPDIWTIETEDALPIRSGTPGLYAFSKTEVYFDNVRVFANP